MANPNEKLAEALEKLSQAEKNGIVRHDSISRTYRERLIRQGFLGEIINGWYHIADPATRTGETTWFAFYWEFIHQYLESRFEGNYCLATEASLFLHSRATNIPKQLIAITKASGTMTLKLPGGLSLMVYRDEPGYPEAMDRIRDLNVLRLPVALVRASEGFFRNQPEEASIVLATVQDSSPILAILLEQGKSTVAGRLAGAFRANHQTEIADDIVSTMRRAEYDVREKNPFERPIPRITSSRNPSPYEVRIRSMWARMREDVLLALPPAPGLPSNPKAFLQEIQDLYANDAYNSLSIEGYRVTPELIERVRSENWNPDGDEKDRESRDALAARGYFEAFEEVQKSVSRLIQGTSASIVRRAHREWYQALFAPSIAAGILKPSDLAGYRNHQVFIKGSMHVPLPAEALMNAMTTLFNLIDEEPEASVRAVLGHFIFVYVHPYGDGNGRLGRFLMNAMLASGGYAWTVIRLATRKAYMAALESASVNGDIRPFADFVASEIPASKQIST